MKKIVLLILVLCTSVACKDRNAVEKPKKIIEEVQMEDMLYDLTLLQSIYSVASYDLQNKRIDGYAFLKNKYGVDSATFVQNHKYYAGEPENFQKIQRRIVERIEAERATLEKQKDKKLRELKSLKK